MACSRRRRRRRRRLCAVLCYSVTSYERPMSIGRFQNIRLYRNHLFRFFCRWLFSCIFLWNCANTIEQYFDAFVYLV